MALLQELKDSNGNLHCDEGPAIIRSIQGEEKQEQEWYKHGKKHRVGGPAIDGPNYTEYWIEGQLHRDGGPSVVFHKGDESGNGVGQKHWHLHGVLVPQNIAESDQSQFDKNWFFKEPNAEVRREIIRKFGAERLFKIDNSKTEKTLGVGEAIVLDTVGDYELWFGRLTETITCKYLKMKNPSIGVWHLEGVGPECKTVKEAIEWRNGGISGNPSILT